MGISRFFANFTLHLGRLAAAKVIANSKIPFGLMRDLSRRLRGEQDAWAPLPQTVANANRCRRLTGIISHCRNLMELGFPELFFIFVLALLLFGPRKLPEIGRQIGKALAEFKRAKNEFTAQIESEVRRLEDETNKILPAEETNVIQAPTTAPAGTVTSTGEITAEPAVNGNGASQETHA